MQTHATNPIREFMTTITPCRARQDRSSSDNGETGVLARASAIMKRIAIATIAVLVSTLSAAATAQSGRPEIFRISPTSGPEGSRVEIAGKNLQEASAVFLGAASSTFTLVSPQQIITLIPHKSVTSTITVVTPRGRASSPFAFAMLNDPRIPDEVSYKAGYVNPIAPPRDFKSALLWGIANRGRAGARPRIRPGGNRLDPACLSRRWQGCDPERRRGQRSRRTVPASALVRHR